MVIIGASRDNEPGDEPVTAPLPVSYKRDPAPRNGAGPNGASHYGDGPNGARPNGSGPDSSGHGTQAGAPPRSRHRAVTAAALPAAVGPPAGPGGDAGQPPPRKPWARLLARLPHRAGSRLGWGLADQAVSSLTNFAVSIYIARELGATQFGAFSLAYVTYSFVLNASRGLATDPLLVRFSGQDLPAWRRAVAACTGTAANVGLVAGLFALAAAAVLHGTARSAFFALALTLPGLMLQDSWRYAFFALGRGSQAFFNDLVWGLVLVPGLVVLRVIHHADVFWFILVWGAAANVAAAVGPLQARVLPRLVGTRQWVAKHRDLGLRYLAENSAIAGASQLRLYGVGLILSLAAVGHVQAASLLMGPFLVVFMGIAIVIVPEAARVLRESPQFLQRFCVLVSIGLSAAAIIWGIALLILLPTGLGRIGIGPIWHPAYMLIIPVTAQVIGSTMSCGATAGLHALGAARRSLRAQIFAAIAFLVGGLVGAYLDGAQGTVRGAALATLVAALVWWWQLRVALRESDQVPTAHRRAAARHRRSTRPAA